MGHHTYYCEVNSKIREYPKGVYKVVADKGINARWFPELNRIITVSDRVWKQGPKGGVKLVKTPWWEDWSMGYVTRKDDYMREFLWAKIRAKEICV